MADYYTDEHEHQCGMSGGVYREEAGCGTKWRHTGNQAAKQGNPEAHSCPKCGKQWYGYSKSPEECLNEKEYKEFITNLAREATNASTVPENTSRADRT